MGSDLDLPEVIRCEQRLLDPSVRAEPQAVDELLHPEFIEFGSSGRVWDRSSIVAALQADPQVTSEGSDYQAVTLTEGVVLLTYWLTGSRPSLRSSIWVKDADRWRLRFHQGTPVT